MQKDSQTLAKLKQLFISFNMFILTLYSYQNSATFQLAETWFFSATSFMSRGPSYGQNIF